MRISPTVVATLTLLWLAADIQAASAPPNPIKAITVRRAESNPLIDATSSPSRAVTQNINGPSVIKVPSWIEQPLGKYYMYFASHNGRYIRLAFANALEGPWTIHEPGTLHVDNAPGFHGHIASPDVHVDDENRQIRMYFHGIAIDEQGKRGQRTGVALSADGLIFEARDVRLGPYYFRVFRWQGWYFAIAKKGDSGYGMLFRSRDGLTPFEEGGKHFRMMRHGAVTIRNGHLLVFYSRAKDAPERIVVATMPLTGDWQQWRESEAIDVIAPERDYEGASHPIEASRYGSATGVRQLRDPCIFEEDGRTYLFYSIAGESGIAMAELEMR